MKRRAFLHTAALATAATALSHPSLLATTPSSIKRVLVIFKCHLDVGFTSTQAAVMRKYFDVYYPAAIQTASALRAAGGDRYTWTTGSWLLFEYFEQAAPAQRRSMEQAIAAGDITWHALPFSWQTEMLDRSMIEGALGFSSTLDTRFGRKTIAAKMTDVPGHTIGIVAPLAAAGVRLLDIGVNAASTPPDVPDVFLWRNSTGRELVMLYHRHDYGSVLKIPGSDLAVSVNVRGDNSGPHTPVEIAAIYRDLRATYPGAHVTASDLNEVATAVEPYRQTLPVITEEIGDTWIYGVPSDPSKVARYREGARLRSTWLAQQRFAPGDVTDCRLLRRLLLAVEHTWGTDTKTYLDYHHYRPQDLAKMLDQPGYQTMTRSWQEKRDDIDQGVASLPEALRTEVQSSLSALTAVPPSLVGLKPWEPAKAALREITTKHYSLSIDSTGAIVGLRNLATGREWASPAHPLALFTYQTLSAADYAGYQARYVVSKADWAPRDFGKPGIEAFGPRAQEWHPTVSQAWLGQASGAHRIVLSLEIDDPAGAASGNVAWPQQAFLELTLPGEPAAIHLRLITLGKQANRLPEAMWLSFMPQVSEHARWLVDKAGEEIDAAAVVAGGGRRMHAVGAGPRCLDRGNTLTIATLDAPVIALEDRSPLNFSKQLPDPAAGIHISLFNNGWGTNYPQWCSGNWSYRFTLLG